MRMPLILLGIIMSLSIVSGDFGYNDPTLPKLVSSGPIDWNDLFNIPSGFADGVDDEGAGGGGAGMWLDGGTYIYPNSTFAENIIIDGYIRALDWSNFTGTESQIIDLSHTVDTRCNETGNCVSMYTDQFIYHAGDPDTYWQFIPDAGALNVGGFQFLTAVEGVTDYLEVNAGNEDIDFIVNWNDGDNAIFVDGNTGVVNMSEDLIVEGNFLATGTDGFIINNYHSAITENSDGELAFYTDGNSMNYGIDEITVMKLGLERNLSFTFASAERALLDWSNQENFQIKSNSNMTIESEQDINISAPNEMVLEGGGRSIIINSTGVRIS